MSLLGFDFDGPAAPHFRAVPSMVTRAAHGKNVLTCSWRPFNPVHLLGWDITSSPVLIDSQCSVLRLGTERGRVRSDVLSLCRERGFCPANLWSRAAPPPNPRLQRHAKQTCGESKTGQERSTG